jgi:RNA polymerase sigma factor (sigma-70 family)
VSRNNPSAAGRGDPQASEWLDQLRARLLAAAGRRVPREVAEDLVQEALMIVAEKGVRGGAAAAAGVPDAIEGLPPLAWCFQVLRNVIGNWYQRERTRRAAADPTSQNHARFEQAGTPGGLPTPLEALERAETAALIHQALGALAAESEACARYLRGIVDGQKPATIARREGLEEAVLYRRIYRCREKLRGLLAARGVSV